MVTLRLLHSTSCIFFAWFAVTILSFLAVTSHYALILDLSEKVPSRYGLVVELLYHVTLLSKVAGSFRCDSLSIF